MPHLLAFSSKCPAERALGLESEVEAPVPLSSHENLVKSAESLLPQFFFICANGGGGGGGNVPAQLPTGFFHKVCVDSEFEASCNVSILTKFLADNFNCVHAQSVQEKASYLCSNTDKHRTFISFIH